MIKPTLIYIYFHMQQETETQSKSLMEYKLPHCNHHKAEYTAICVSEKSDLYLKPVCEECSKAKQLKPTDVYPVLKFFDKLAEEVEVMYILMRALIRFYTFNTNTHYCVYC